MNYLHHQEDGIGSRKDAPFPLFVDNKVDASVSFIEHTSMYIFLLSSKIEY